MHPILRKYVRDPVIAMPVRFYPYPVPLNVVAIPILSVNSPIQPLS